MKKILRKTKAQRLLFVVLTIAVAIFVSNLVVSGLFSERIADSYDMSSTPRTIGSIFSMASMLVVFMRVPSFVWYGQGVWDTLKKSKTTVNSFKEAARRLFVCLFVMFIALGISKGIFVNFSVGDKVVEAIASGVILLGLSILGSMWEYRTDKTRNPEDNSNHPETVLE